MHKFKILAPLFIGLFFLISINTSQAQTQRTRAYLHTRFETGDKPTQTDYRDVFATFFSKVEDSLSVSVLWGIDSISYDPTLVDSSYKDLVTEGAVKAYVDANAGSVSSGDKGDITVSGGTWTIDNDAVDAATIAAGAVGTSEIANNSVANADLAQMATNTIKGNDAGGTATPQDLTTSEVKTMLAIQTTDLSDYEEATEDLIGANLVAGAGASVVYDDGTGNVTISSASLADGDKGDIDITSSGTVFTIDTSAVNSLKISDGSIELTDLNFVPWHSGNDGAGSTLDADLLDGQQGSYYLDLDNATNAIATSQIEDDAVTLAKQAAGTANRVQGWDASGNPSEYTAGSNITISGGQISAAGGISGLTTNYLPKATSSTTIANSSIYDNGYVGIGTTTPPERLTVNGGLEVLASAAMPSGGAGIQISFDANGGRIQTFAGKPIQLNPLGNNIGIGTTSPTQRLDVNGIVKATNILIGSDTDINAEIGRLKTGSYVSDYVYLSHFDHGTLSNYALSQSPTGATKINAAAGQTLNFLIANAEKLTVNSSGNVGIGTTTPVNILDVEGGMAIGAAYSGTSVAPSNGAIIEGDVGIGTASPSHDLQVEDSGIASILIKTTGNVNANLLFENSSDANDSWMLRRDAAGEFVIAHSSAQPFASETMVIEATATEVRIHQDLVIDETGNVRIMVGSGTPESAITAGVGSTYHRTDGGASTSFYVKESGTGNTGWVAK